MKKINIGKYFITNNYLMKILFIMKLSVIFLFFIVIQSTAGVLSNTVLLGNTDKSMQQIMLSGLVEDTEGVPLPGVSVMVKGTTIGVVTDTDGRFSITVPSDATTLVFSFVGMETQEVNIGDRTEFNIIMDDDVIGLEEVIAVGYGTQRRANISGSVDQVTSQSIENKPVPSVGHAMQGVIPNLNLDVRPGRPGSTPGWNVRGYESITGGSPLILVDGVPRSANHLNPDDIESISVLKDASASAIYGARGAFGVVLIQTKRAKTGDLQVNIHSRFTGEVPIWKWDPVEDPYLHHKFVNDANIRAGNTGTEPHILEGAKRYSENPTAENAWVVHGGTLFWVGGGGSHDHYRSSFQDLFVRDVIPKQNHNLDVQGGSESARYYGSIGWNEEPGIFKEGFGNEYYQRLNTDLKVDLDVTDWLSLNPSISYTNRQRDYPHHYSGGAAYDMINRFGAAYYVGGFPSTDHFDAPDYPGRDYSDYEGMYIGENHPIPYYQQGGRNIDSHHDIYFTQGVTINPFTNFVFKGDFTYRHYNRRGEDVRSQIDKLAGRFDGTIDLMQDVMVNAGYSSTTYVINRYNQNHYYFFNAVGEYELDDVDSPHYFKAMVGFNQEWNTNRYTFSQAYDMVTPATGSINATVGDQWTNSSEAHLALRGAFSRINYNYQGRYLIELSGRYDGTSRFPMEDRFGLFPSASAAWRISEENFMARFDFLSNLMVRASYGELGNQGVGGYYPYIASMGISTAWYLMDGERVPMVSPPGLVSPTLTWEKTQTRNLGFNLGLFNQRLSFEFDTYTRATLDMLMRFTYPAILGAGAPQENAADLETRGWEFKATYHGRGGADWGYNLSFNIADNETEITRYHNPTGAINTHYEGRIIGEIWGYETVGIFQTDEEVENAPDQSRIESFWRAGDIQYADLNDDGEISPGDYTLEDPGDRRIIGNSRPRYTYGINMDLNYKNFGVNIFLQGIGQRDWYPPTGNHQIFFPAMAQGVQKYHITESWSEDNRDAYFPIATRLNNKNYQTQTRFLQDASYLRLKNMVLRYEVPTGGTLSNLGLQRLQVYLSGYNLLTFTNMHHSTDPEYLWDRVSYPMYRSFSLGVRVSF